MAKDTELCGERLKFESLLVGIASRFVNLPADEVHASIDDALREVCECLDLELSALWQWEADSPDVFVLTNLYRKLDEIPVPERMEARQYHPWVLGEVLANRTVVLSSVEDAPESAARDLETWRHFGVKTLLTIPLSVGGNPPFGAVSYNDMEKLREWTPAMVHHLEVVSQVFASALVRQRYEQALKESDERLKLAVDAVDAGIWVWSTEREEFWVSDRLAELFGIPAGSALPLQAWLDLIHEEDRELAHTAFKEGMSTDQLAMVEYRIVNSDGSIRWMHARGRTCMTSDGTSRFMGIAGDATKSKEAELKLQETLAEVERLKNQLNQENIYLRDHLRDSEGHGEVLGKSPVVRRMLDMANRVAKTDAMVLITGETGTGKELLARYIHEYSSRKSRAMVCVNCAALPATLIESELFGREKGAYTGAMTKQVGRFEIADGSTLFLDEIGDMPLEVQAKLLRVLEYGSFEKLGSNKTQRVDVRIIAATNVDLAEKVQQNLFREDLYHRLNVFPIESPPLRQRIEDIPELTWHFVSEFNSKMGRGVNSIPREVMESLKTYRWPGNVRELRNLIERAMILVDGTALAMVLPQTESSGKETSSMEDVERKHIVDVLEQTNWRIGGSDGAAERLGMARTTLNSRMKKLGISRN